MVFYREIKLKILEDVGDEGFEYISFQEVQSLPIQKQQQLLKDTAGQFEIKSGTQTLTFPMDDLSYIFEVFFRYLANILITW